MSNSIYLNLVGYIIKVTFKINIKEVGILAREKLKNEINQTFSSVIIRNYKPSKVDFYIDVFDPNFLELIYEKRSGKVYQQLFIVLNKNRIGTTVQINIYQFRAIVWTYFTKMLNKRNGFILHSSGVSVGGRAFLFLGRSGAGKSTTASLLAKYFPTIADDMGVFYKESGNYYYFSLPLPEKVAWIRKENIRYDMGKVFFLKKSKDFRIEKITDKEEILKKFINQGFASEETKDIMQYILDFVSSFDEFYYLYFAKDSEKLYKLISEHNHE